MLAMLEGTEVHDSSSTSSSSSPPIKNGAASAPAPKPWNQRRKMVDKFVSNLGQKIQKIIKKYRPDQSTTGR